MDGSSSIGHDHSPKDIADDSTIDPRKSLSERHLCINFSNCPLRVYLGRISNRFALLVRAPSISDPPLRPCSLKVHSTYFYDTTSAAMSSSYVWLRRWLSESGEVVDSYQTFMHAAEPMHLQIYLICMPRFKICMGKRPSLSTWRTVTRCGDCCCRHEKSNIAP